MEFCGFKKWQQLSILIIFSIFFTSCHSEIDKRIWSLATFDIHISKEPIFAQLDNQKELFSVFETPDSFRRRTSDVEYSTGKTMNLREFNNLKVTHCRAHFHSGTLSINIGIGTGFGGKGFMIKYEDQNFTPNPIFLLTQSTLMNQTPRSKLFIRN